MPRRGKLARTHQTVYTFCSPNKTIANWVQRHAGASLYLYRTMDKLIAFLKEKFDRELSRIKEILAEFIRRGEKSPAPKRLPHVLPPSSRSWRKYSRERCKKIRKILKLFTTWGRCMVKCTIWRRHHSFAGIGKN